jgi:hypothetical protein
MTHLRFNCLMFLTFALSKTLLSQCYAEDTTVMPRGEYAKIDVKLETEAINVLKNGKKMERHAKIAQIKASPQKYAPIVFCVMGEVLFNEGEVDDGAFWFYAGMLRARFDASRCTDVSASEGIPLINRQYGVNINRYVAQDPEATEALIRSVVEWDRKTPYAYDHRWINLHGMQAVMTSMNVTSTPQPLSVPKEQWAELAEKTRLEYVRGIHEALQAARNQSDSATK